LLLFGVSTVKLDQHGFPIPEGFDGEPIATSPGVKKRNWIVALLLGVAALAGFLAVELGPRVASRVKQEIGRQHAGKLVHRADRMLRAGATREAVDELSRAIAIDPANVEAFRLRGGVLGQLHRYEQAAADYGRVIELHPEDATAYNNRAYNLALAGTQLEQALEDVEKALALGGPNEAFLDTRGYLLFLLGRPEEALNDLNAAVNLVRRQASRQARSDAGEIYYHRALVHQELGNRESAEQDFQQAKQLGYHAPLPV
jgi:tetratricopeptide (TPR) repeat protein